ncbi:MAG: DUF6491 family protein [Pseudomonadota bacterium]
MTRVRPLLIATAVLALAGAATPASPRDDDLARELAGRTAGKTQDCVDTSRVGGPQIIDDRTILYRESGRRVWRNDLPDSCPGLRPNDTMVIELYGSQYCRNDHFRSYSAGDSIPGAMCRLGTFTPYDKPAKVK